MQTHAVMSEFPSASEVAQELTESVMVASDRVAAWHVPGDVMREPRTNGRTDSALPPL